MSLLQQVYHSLAVKIEKNDGPDGCIFSGVSLSEIRRLYVSKLFGNRFSFFFFSENVILRICKNVCRFKEILS